MNKIIRVLVFSCVLIVLLSVFSLAASKNSYIFYYDDREITVEGNGLNREEAQIIADYIALGIIPEGTIEENPTRTNILCVLFGHSIENITVLETIHNVYTTSPKCVENTYDVDHCTRSNCDYIVKTLLYSIRISTCHG